MTSVATPPEVPSVSTGSGFIAPAIPTTVRASLSAWLKGPARDTAAAELELYSRATPYFVGATLGNAPNTILSRAFAAASSHEGVPEDLDPIGPEGKATVGRELAPDGKVGSIRLVDIGPDRNPDHAGGLGSWFKQTHPRLVNVLEIGTPEDKGDEEKIVLVHGYGAGTAFFFQNFAAMASHPNSRLYALDWLGMGRSARVPFSLPASALKTTETRVEAAESFFVDSLEDWRIKTGVEKMTLIGHSLGGYLSIAYSLRHPERVSRLILISPAGLPRNPNVDAEESTFAPKAGNATSPSRRSSSSSARSTYTDDVGEGVAAEVLQPQAEIVSSDPATADNDADKLAKQVDESGKESPSEQLNSSASKRSADAEFAQQQQPPRISKRTRAVFSKLWEMNFSPFGLLRNLHFFAPLMVGKYSSRRFGTLPDADLRPLHAYCAGIFTAKGSSEYCLAHLLAPGAFARMPMVDRVAPLKIPVTTVYGDHDWMDVNGGREVVKRLAAAGNNKASCFVVPNAGHHTYLDNPRAMDRLMLKILSGKADGPRSSKSHGSAASAA